ncbi:hypothetical protein RHGRI_029621 [Rhododendron griersonianum]|uniref:Uncharacterized protein n=1 Tax=Rhododendron griersonianum TaxID=479676 RepID=A0AAV6IK57_9ERIC|nr:hypothetical protein RHGRI_029621 [Rhododendron griersonianum]
MEEIENILCRLKLNCYYIVQSQSSNWYDRELTTSNVLGFPNTEVSYLLFGGEDDARRAAEFYTKVIGFYESDGAYLVIVPRVPRRSLKQVLSMYRMELFDHDRNGVPTRVSQGFQGILRRRSRSGSPRRRRSRSPASRRRRSRSPTPKRYKRQRSRSTSLSPLPKSRSPSVVSNGKKNAVEKLRKEEEEKKRRQQEEELRLLEEETARRLEEAIRKKVEERLNSEEVKLEIEKRIEESRKKVFDDVDAQLKKEKEAALIEARQKEEQARKEREELDKMLEENQRRVEEAQRREALEQLRKEEERYRELEMIQRQKEEAARRKKLEEEEERMKLVKNKSGPKQSFGMG